MSSHSEGICCYKLHCKPGGCLGVQGVIAFPGSSSAFCSKMGINKEITFVLNFNLLS